MLGMLVRTTNTWPALHTTFRLRNIVTVPGDLPGGKEPFERARDLVFLFFRLTTFVDGFVHL